MRIKGNMRKSQKMLKNQNNMPRYRTQDQRGNELSPSPLGHEWLAVILQCQMGFINQEKIGTKKIKENKTKMIIIIKKRDCWVTPKKSSRLAVGF